MGICLSQGGFAAHDRFSVVAAAGDGVVQDPDYARPGYDLGRPVEVELALESLFYIEGLAMDGCGGEDARVEVLFLGKANKPRTQGGGEHSDFAW